jgi:hypothetical protein
MVGLIGVAPVEVLIDGGWTPVVAIRIVVRDSGYEETELLVRQAYDGRLAWVPDYRVSDVRLR